MNPRGVTLLGVELAHVYIAVWAIYGILVGVAGVLLGMFLGVSSYSVGPLTASAFSIVVLGGLGSVSGALIAAYVVGYLETITAYLISPAYRTIPALFFWSRSCMSVRAVCWGVAEWVHCRRAAFF
jgi:branched-chain amino acid transport system permease protein